MPLEKRQGGVDLLQAGFYVFAQALGEKNGQFRL